MATRLNLFHLRLQSHCTFTSAAPLPILEFISFQQAQLWPTLLMRPAVRVYRHQYRPLPPWSRVGVYRPEDLERDQVDELRRIPRDQGDKLRQAMRGYQ